MFSLKFNTFTISAWSTFITSGLLIVLMEHFVSWPNLSKSGRILKETLMWIMVASFIAIVFILVFGLLNTLFT